MAANSTIRRLVKAIAHRVIGERGYAWLQARTMARDIQAGRVREPELDLLAAVQPGDTVIDVGANYGFWTEPMARAVGATGKVIAFEPVPFTVRTLRQVVRILGLANVEVRAEACGEDRGELILTVPVQGSGAISAGQAHLATRDDDRPGREAHVRWSGSTDVRAAVVRLDDVVPVDEVAFLKCDVEGAEPHVLRGARAVLERSHPTIVAEINPWFLDGFGESVAGLVEELGQLGYILYRYDGSRLVPTDIADVVEDNYVFVHPRRRASLERFLSASSS